MADLGFCCASGDSEDRDRTMKSALIDKQLAREKDKLRSTYKILLLGSAESGKSTVMKQMRIINGKDFLPEEVLQYKLTIYHNIVKGMKVLVDACNKLQLNISQPENLQHADFVFSYCNSTRLNEEMFIQYKPSVTKLWQDKGIQEAFDRRKEFHLGDSLKYFMENIERISVTDYRPSNQDILHARGFTRSILEYEFNIKGNLFRFVDVGGQRSQRQKWYQCFEGVTCILFLVSSSEYDQVLLEDKKTNRLIESCDVFEAIVNNKTFDNVSIILFFNKIDLLEGKILRSDIKLYFPDTFPSTSDSRKLEDVKKFEVEMFKSRTRDASRSIFHHFTTAIDTENIKHVFADTRDTILHKNINNLMLQ